MFFDLGGTLFEYSRREGLGRATAAVFERLGFSPTDPAVVAARQRASQEVEARYAVLPAFLHRDLFRERLVRAAELLGVPMPAEVLDLYDAEHLDGLLEHLLPRPDAHEALAALRERGLHTAVVSNADDAWVGPLLVRHGLDALVDGWTSSEEAWSCKPHRGIFDHALAKAGRTAAETVYVGDSPVHDVAGANAVGMRTVLIGEPGTVAPLSHGLEARAQPDAEVRTLIEVVAVVDRFNGA